jgi:hypothetical protein
MASTMASIIGDPAATNGQPSSLSLQVQTQAVDVSQVRILGPSILYSVHAELPHDATCNAMLAVSK